MALDLQQQVYDLAGRILMAKNTQAPAVVADTSASETAPEVLISMEDVHVVRALNPVFNELLSVAAVARTRAENMAADRDQ
jgi:hypothetical protein